MKRWSDPPLPLSKSTKPCNPVQSFVCLSFVAQNKARRLSVYNLRIDYITFIMFFALNNDFEKVIINHLHLMRMSNNYNFSLYYNSYSLSINSNPPVFHNYSFRRPSYGGKS